MKIALFCEYGKKREIGTGHLHRLKGLERVLKSRSHEIVWIAPEGVVDKTANVLVIDHVFSQQSIIAQAKDFGLKVVLMDGSEEDVPMVDISISPAYNKLANYTGTKYFVLPYSSEDRYKLDIKSNSVFVGMGGYDANNYAPRICEVLGGFGLNAIVAKSINNSDDVSCIKNAVMFEEYNYYDAMRECIFAITNGGLTLAQALHFGMPTICVPQYEHQRRNAELFPEGCLLSDIDSLSENIELLVSSSYRRESLSRFGQHYVDGKGLDRVCSLIELLGVVR